MWTHSQAFHIKRHGHRQRTAWHSAAKVSFKHTNTTCFWSKSSMHVPLGKVAHAQLRQKADSNCQTSQFRQVPTNAGPLARTILGIGLLPAYPVLVWHGENLLCSAWHLVQLLCFCAHNGKGSLALALQESSNVPVWLGSLCSETLRHNTRH